jgi:hypothetical protein
MVRLVLGNAAGGAARILSAEPLAGLAAELGGGWSGDGLNGAREDERSSDLDDSGAELHCGCKVELYHELVVDRTAFGRKEGGVLYVQRCFYLFYFIFWCNLFLAPFGLRSVPRRVPSDFLIVL